MGLLSCSLFVLMFSLVTCHVFGDTCELISAYSPSMCSWVAIWGIVVSRKVSCPLLLEVGGFQVSMFEGRKWQLFILLQAVAWCKLSGFVPIPCSTGPRFSFELEHCKEYLLSGKLYSPAFWFLTTTKSRFGLWFVFYFMYLLEEAGQDHWRYF